MKRFFSIGNLKAAYDFQDMDKKPNKRTDGKPRVRKEDISKPVDFRHVEGYTKNKDGTIRKGSMSACTSPTSIGPEFFHSSSVPNDSHRLSDPSTGLPEFSNGKENRFSSTERYQQYKNEEDFYKYEDSRSSFGDHNNAPIRSSKNSGSLRNLNFLQFAKQANPPGLKIKGDNSPKSKRLSLGALLPSARSSFTPSETYPPPISPIYETIAAENGTLTRRRSSSFSGDSDSDIVQLRHAHQRSNIKTVTSTAPVTNNQRTSIFNWNKKPKYAGTQHHEPPPMSPTYDQLPPPPAFQDDYDDTLTRDSMLPLPECPSYSDLPPPPSTASQEEINLVQRRGFKGSPLTIPHEDEEALPPPPSPMSPVQTEQESGTIKRRPKKPPPNIKSPVVNVSTLEKKVPAWRSRAVKVSAPTIPPASVPFVKNSPKEGSPVTPESWPLEPTYPHLENGQPHYEEIGPYVPPSYALEYKEFTSMPNLSQLNSLQPVESKKVDRDHLKPLSSLLQQRVPVDLWPVVMTQLFSSCNISEDANARQIHSGSAAYSELITKTLELLIEMKNGDVSFDEVISAFDKTQQFAEEKNNS